MNYKVLQSLCGERILSTIYTLDEIFEYLKTALDQAGSCDVADLFFSSVPEGVANPKPDGVNATVMSIRWQSPAQMNGPPPTYSIRRYSPAFSIPPQSVERGYHFTGLNYYMFPPETIPIGVTFTGRRSNVFSFFFLLYSLTRYIFDDNDSTAASAAAQRRRSLIRMSVTVRVYKRSSDLVS
jgi:hypothetical protein